MDVLGVLLMIMEFSDVAVLLGIGSVEAGIVLDSVNRVCVKSNRPEEVKDVDIFTGTLISDTEGDCKVDVEVCPQSVLVCQYGVE